MKGFLACGGDAAVDQFWPDFDPGFGRKAHPIFVNEEPLVEDYDRHSIPYLFFERDQYVFVAAPWGRGKP